MGTENSDEFHWDLVGNPKYNSQGISEDPNNDENTD